MTEHSADVLTDLIPVNIQPDQAIARMTEAVIAEVSIAGEEGWSSKLVQEWDDCLVLDSLLRQVVADLADGNSVPP